MLAYVNGNLVPETGAAVDVFDHGFTVGDGVFETVAIRQGTAMALSRHLARLSRSALGLGLAPPEAEVVRAAVHGTLEANPAIERGAIRITWTSGAGPVGSVRGDGQPTLVVGVRRLEPYRPVVRVAVVPWPRNERGALAGLKSTSYAENVVALAEARRRGAEEAIFANTAGRLCEGSGTNVFIAMGGRLMTPPLSSGCLAGITRGLLIEACGLDIDERDLPVSALAEADEAFLTSATRDVHPIEAVDGRARPAPGPLTKAAATAYAALLAADPDPA